MLNVEKAMNGLCRSVAVIGVLVVAACVDAGPTTQDQITQDITSSRWMGSDMLQLMPGDTPRTIVFENQHLVQ